MINPCYLINGEIFWSMLPSRAEMEHINKLWRKVIILFSYYNENTSITSILLYYLLPMEPLMHPHTLPVLSPTGVREDLHRPHSLPLHLLNHNYALFNILWMAESTCRICQFKAIIPLVKRRIKPLYLAQKISQVCSTT